MLDKYVIAMGAAAGVGVVVPKVLEEYVEVQFGPIIPGLETLGNWGRFSVFIPLVAGAGTFIISQFTNWVANKSKIANDAMGVFGITSLVCGALNGVFSMPAGRATAPQRIPQQLIRQQIPNGPTPTGISGKIIVA